MRTEGRNAGLSPRLGRPGACVSAAVGGLRVDDLEECGLSLSGLLHLPRRSGRRLLVGLLHPRPSPLCLDGSLPTSLRFGRHGGLGTRRVGGAGRQSLAVGTLQAGQRMPGLVRLPRLLHRGGFASPALQAPQALQEVAQFVVLLEVLALGLVRRGDRRSLEALVKIRAVAGVDACVTGAGLVQCVLGESGAVLGPLRLDVEPCHARPRLILRGERRRACAHDRRRRPLARRGLGRGKLVLRNA
mmetsp:Transcript_36817/g.106199  ORF Transcript_36817/g.106199 Transcript_36817/m.106199 type:complete len:244 (-) Transcript_36817:347-1078(-)